MPLFRTILFAADFSDRSRAAFRIACTLADEHRTRLFVLHVVEPAPMVEQAVASNEQGAPVGPGAGDGHAHHAALLERLRELYAPTHPIDAAYEVRDGVAADELLRRARELGADLIVMGTHGRTGLRRLMTGSVAEAVLRRSHSPVLALHAVEAAATAAEPPVVLHPTDFSPTADGALDVARTLARDLGARLILLHVAPLGTVVGGTMPIPVDLRPHAEALATARDQVDGPDLKYPAEVQLCQGGTVAEILAAAEATRAALVVIGTHGRTGLGRVLMGSVAEAVLRESGQPVLIVRAPGPIAEAARRDEAAATAT